MLPRLLYDLFSGNPQQGPGSNECTRRAYSVCGGLPSRPEILDVDCGSGMQTLELARISDGNITALDDYQPVLDTLNENVKSEGLSSRVTVVKGTMFELPYAVGSCDLILSEGAIFIMGFENGLHEWKPLLKKGGYMVVSELTYIRQDIPRELVDYLQSIGAAILNNEGNRKSIRDAGYAEIGNFVLPKAG